MKLFWFKKQEKSAISKDRLRHLDSDLDGLSDYEEMHIYGTNPYDPDTDKDGMNDGEEVRQGRNPKGAGRLKDLFIPHIGNDYQPEILRPQRLVFYSLAAVVTKLVIFGFVVLFPAGAWLTPDILTQEGKKIVALTNSLRQSLSVPALKESNTLDQAAFKKAQDMLINQYFAHIGPDGKDVADWLLAGGYKYDVAGENLAIGFANAEEVVAAWKKSPTHYANLIDPDFNDIGVGLAVGPYNGAETTLVAQFFGTTTQAPVQAASVNNQVEVKSTQPTPTVNSNLNQNSQSAPKPTTNINTNVNKNTNPTQSVNKVPDKKVVLAEPKTNTNISKTAPAKPQVAINTNQDTNTNLVTKPPVKPAVLPKLAQPILLLPLSNFISQNGQVNLIVYAPKAQTVVVYENDKEIARRDSLNSDFFDLMVNFTENGNHILSFKALTKDQVAVSNPYLIVVEKVIPIIDEQNSKLMVVNLPNQEEQILKAVAYLSSDVTEATVVIGDYQIELEKGQVGSTTVEWTGQLLIFSRDQKKIFNTITLPLIKVKNGAGNTAEADIAWENVIPLQPSLVKQYLFMKSYPLTQVDWLFQISGYYYRLLLVIAVVSLLLTIFIEIKKQYPRVIASTLGFITLLIVLIII